MRTLNLSAQEWPVRGSFRISRSSLTKITVVTAEITDGSFTGTAECRPYSRYNETASSVLDAIEPLREDIENGSLDIKALQNRLPPGAARNLIDCALWSLKAQKQSCSLASLLGIDEPKARKTAFTLSIDEPRAMAKKALEVRDHRLLKIKIGGMEGLDSCLSVMEARPDAELIIDANEALTTAELKIFSRELSGAPVVMIEQPLPDMDFDKLDIDPAELPIICADESLHSRSDLKRLWQAGYRAVNVKLDKTGGLTEAYQLMLEAKKMGFIIMAGCMVGTSLAMRPILALESLADYIDLDGPLLLAKDRAPELTYKGSMIFP